MVNFIISCISLQLVWRAVPENIITSLHTKYFFDAASSCFLSTWNTFLCYINTFLSTPNYFLCNVKLSVSTKNCFSCNTKFLFWTSFRILCYVYFYCHIATCQKINISFLCDTKKLITSFTNQNFFIFIFYIAHWKHVDLFRSGLGNKETFNPSLTHLSDIPN